MHLWNTRQLAQALRDDRLSERDKVAYLLVGTGLQFILGRSTLVTQRLTLGGILIVLAVFGISILGLVHAFQLNQRGDGSRFIERCVVLIVPLTLQFYVL